MSEVYAKLPDDVRKLIDTPLVPFDELEPYDENQGLYELDGRTGEQGKYQVELLMQKVGGELLLLTRVETTNGAKLFDVSTPIDKAKDSLNHVFPSAPVEEVENLFPRAA